MAKWTLSIAILLFSYVLALAVNPPKMKVFGTPSVLYNSEAHPGAGLRFHLMVPRECLKEGKLNIRTYESEQLLKSPDTLKPERVRVIHVHAMGYEKCTKGLKATQPLPLEVRPDPLRATQVHLIIEPGITVEDITTVK